MSESRNYSRQYQTFSKIVATIRIDATEGNRSYNLLYLELVGMSAPTTDVDLPPVATLPALVTPFETDETVDHDSLSTLVQWTVDRGVHGVVPCGTTGEFASLSRTERRAVIETTVEAADGRAPVIAGTAGTTVDRVQTFIDDAATVGADAALVTPPYYHAANDPAGNRTFFERITDRSALPIYLYNIPMCTGQSIAVETVRELAENDVIQGMKDTSGDFSAIERFIARTPDSFRVLEGYDDHFVGAGVMGSDGGINAMAGVFPEALSRLCDALQAGDLEEARTIQREIISPMFDVALEYGFAPVSKIALEERGIIPQATVRPPLVELNDDSRKSVADAVVDAVSYL